MANIENKTFAYDEMMVHVPLCSHKDIKKILVVGNASDLLKNELDKHECKDITFVDTPGHEAFTSMRVRGASVTDIIILVVAADDGVKPQTLEVIKLAQESGAPIIVALNKMDKETAQPDMVKGQMAEHGMNPADWGGDITFVPVSAKSGLGIDDLLEEILSETEYIVDNE